MSLLRTEDGEAYVINQRVIRMRVCFVSVIIVYVMFVEINIVYEIIVLLKVKSYSDNNDEK